MADTRMEKARWRQKTKAEATLGEISDAMRDVFGEHREHGGL